MTDNSPATDEEVEAAIKAVALVKHQAGFTSADHERAVMRAALNAASRIRAETAKNSGEVVAWLTRVNYRREGQSEFLVCEKDQAGAFPVYAASGGVDNVR